jgi:hypothetical protein
MASKLADIDAKLGAIMDLLEVLYSDDEPYVRPSEVTPEEESKGSEAPAPTPVVEEKSAPTALEVFFELFKGNPS